MTRARLCQIAFVASIFCAFLLLAQLFDRSFEGDISAYAEYAPVVALSLLFALALYYSRREFARSDTPAGDLPIISTTPNGTITRWSDGCEDLFGWPAAEAIGRRVDELLGIMRPLSMAQRAQHLSAHGTYLEKIGCEARDGRRLHLLEHARTTLSRAGRPQGIVLTFFDIADHERRSVSYGAVDTVLTLALESDKIGFFEWHAHPDAMYLSPQAETLLGLIPGSFSGGMARWRAYLRTSFPGNDFPHDLLAATAPPGFIRFRLAKSQRHPNPRRIDGTMQYQLGTDGSVTSIKGILFDAIEQDERTAKLEARESELRTILETIPDAMITIDGHGRIRSFSNAAEQLFGYNAKSLLGLPVVELLPLHLRSEMVYALENYRRSGNTEFLNHTQSTVALHSDGTKIPVELVVSEARLGEQRILIGFVRDMRERIAAQTRMAELRDQLLHVSRLSAMGEMAAGLAHELNQPLAAATNFLGAAEMLLNDEKITASQVRNLVQLASGQTLRAGSIIQRVRSFAVRGDTETHVESATRIIVEAVSLMLSGTQRGNVSIDYDFDEDLPSILVDRVQIQQVLVNLIRNAIEAFDDGDMRYREIILGAHSLPEAMVEITVADNGPGMAPAFIARSHEPFMSTKAHGMGVGLSICRRIVEAHGGVLTVSNRPTGGTVVRFTVRSISETELATH